MSRVCENPCTWTDYLLETIDSLTCHITNLFNTTLGITLHTNDIAAFGDEILQKLSLFFHELIALLSFDDFQLQLLKVFLLTFVSTVALIFVAWHVYGSRISEQFMNPSSMAEDCHSSSEE